jgi:hypothetical protein
MCLGLMLMNRRMFFEGHYARSWTPRVGYRVRVTTSQPTSSLCDAWRITQSGAGRNSRTPLTRSYYYLTNKRKGYQ